MSEAGYTYSDISISPYKFEKIINLSISRGMNDHASLYLYGTIPEDELDKYVENASDGESVGIFVNDGGAVVPLFQGAVTKISVSVVANVRCVAIEALSSTFLMDVKKKDRSFQNKDSLYSDIFKKVTGEYKKGEVIDEASKGKPTGGLLVQYHETDWEFIKRLASHFNAPLVPTCTHTGIKYYIGVPDIPEKYNLEDFNYSVVKDLKGYKIKAENDIKDLDERDLISYEVTTRKILELCSPVKYKDKKLYVHSVQIEMINGILSNSYVLRDMKGLGRHKLNNNLLSGTSLFGKIIDVAKDMVKVHLDIDETQSVDEAMWFPYSTVYSSPDGTGWYCMPEKDDQVRLYFSDNDEKNAFCASSVNLTSSAPEKRSDPAVKSISTKYGKQVIFKPGAIEIIAGEELLLKLTDDGGMEFTSAKKIIFDAKEDIVIKGDAKVTLDGKDGIELNQSGTSIKIKDDVTISGGQVKIE